MFFSQTVFSNTFLSLDALEIRFLEYVLITLKPLFETTLLLFTILSL